MKRDILFACMASAMAGIAVAAPLLAGRDPLAALALRGFFRSLCHQNPARSFSFEGSPVAVCVRCLGIYCGVAMGAWAGVVPAVRLRIEQALTRRIFFAALLLNALDVAAESLHLHGNLPLSRFLLGIALGLAAGVLLCGGTRDSQSAQRFG